MDKDLFVKLFINVTIRRIIVDHLKNSCKCHIKDNSYFNGKLIVHLSTPPRVIHYKWDQVIDSPRSLATYGYLELLKLYYERYPLPTIYFSSLLNILSMKPLDLFQQLRLQYCLNAAINHHQLHIIKYYFEELYIRKDEFLNESMKLAITINNVEVVDYLLSFDYGFDYTEAFATAPLSNNMELVEMFSNLYFEKKHQCDTEYDKLTRALTNSANVGRLDMMKWLMQTYYNNNIGEIELNYNKCYQYSIQNGHLHILKYLVENNLPYDLSDFPYPSVDYFTELIDIAIKNNQLEILKYLNSNDDLSQSASTNPIDQGHQSDLEMIEWFFQNRTEPCTSKLHTNAARNGRLDILQWLHENNIEGFTDQTMDFAAIGKHLHVIKWLYENRTEGCTFISMDYANDLEIIKYLHYKGNICTNVAMDNANLEVKKWLRENRTEGCTSFALDNAASCNDLESLKWLHENYTKGCTWVAFYYSASTGSFEVVKWLYDNGYYDKYRDGMAECWPDNFLPELLQKECNRKNVELFRWCIRTLPIKPLIKFQSKINNDTVSSTIYINEINQYLSKNNNKTFCLIN